jgi:O-antigen/teichoic acid export membrane protein
MAREKSPKIGQINLVNNLKKSPPEFLSSAFVNAEQIHNKDPFAQPHSDDVGRLARIGAKWAVGMLVVRQIVTMLTTMVVSRFVTPADMGTVAMVTTFISFIILFDTGLTWATVQTKDISKEQLDSLFWMGVLLGSTLWLVCVIAGPLLAQFYKNNNLKLACAVMGLSPFFNSLTTQLSAFLKRQMRQKASNSIDAAAIILSCMIGITMALLRMGYWAIIAQLVAMQVFRFILLFVSSEYKPGAPQLSRSMMPLIKSGGYLAFSNYICYFQLYLGSILVGRVFGSVILGNYMKAFGMKTMPTEYATMVVTDVMVASLAAYQMDKARMGAAYRKALMLTAFVGCPAGAMLFPMAPEVVRFFFGPQWDMAIPLLQWLALPAVMLPITTTTIWLFLAAGKGREQLRMNIWLSAVTVIAFLLAVRFTETPQGFVAVEAVLFALPFPIVNLVASHRAVGISLRATQKIIIPIIVCSLITAGVVIVLGEWLSGMGLHWLLMFVLKGGAGVLLYLLLALMFIRPFPISTVERYLLQKSYNIYL